MGNKKIYIIKECDKFNNYSANTILKFLEEPNDDIIGILLTTNRYKVIDTILSRCQIISFIDDFKFEFNNDFIDLIYFLFNIKDSIDKYDYIYKNYFADKNCSKSNLIYLEEVLVNYINHNVDLPILNNYDNFIISNVILVVEDNLSKLNYNINLNLWFDDLIVRIMEVLG